MKNLKSSKEQNNFHKYATVAKLDKKDGKKTEENLALTPLMALRRGEFSVFWGGCRIVWRFARRKMSVLERVKDNFYF